MAEANGSCLAIGLMTGTSMDGIDAALIETDGVRVLRTAESVSHSFDPAFAERLRSLLGPAPERKPGFAEIEAELTDRHAEAVKALLLAAGLSAVDIRAVGFHGQTVFHAPKQGVTCQIGDGARLAAALGIPVVADFRSEDVRRGGEGAPFAPLYHRAMAAELPRPLAVLNLGGVGNVTWLGEGEDDILAFDSGPANAMLDDWCRRHTGAPHDEDGRLAASGIADEAALARMMGNAYFAETPPKSLDRNAFDAGPVEALTVENGAATLLAFSIEAVAVARAHLPVEPVQWVVCGGGRRNSAMMRGLARRLGVAVIAAEDAGWDGDALEAQAFAYLAVRSLEGLPLSLPTTTGVDAPCSGGRVFSP